MKSQANGLHLQGRNRLLEVHIFNVTRQEKRSNKRRAFRSSAMGEPFD